MNPIKHIPILLCGLIFCSFKGITCYFFSVNNQETITITPNYCKNLIRIKRTIQSKNIIQEAIYCDNVLIQSTEFNVWFSIDSNILPVVKRRENLMFMNGIQDRRVSTFHRFSYEKKELRLSQDTFLSVNYSDNGLYSSITINTEKKLVYGVEFDKSNRSYWEGYYKGTTDTINEEHTDGSFTTIITWGLKKGTWYKVDYNNNTVDSVIEN